jgi:acylglycerol lipase
MQHREEKFAGAGSLELYYQAWIPESPRAALVIVHGFGEHSGRYPNLVKQLVPRGYALYGFDHRGHGRSPGRRGHINAWSEYRDDVRAFLQVARQQQPRLPVFLFGHSLGGLIVLEYVCRGSDGLAGVVASGPALTPARLSPFVAVIVKVLSRVAPNKPIKTGLDASAISRDPAVVEAYRQDGLVHGYGTPRLGIELSAAQAWTNAHARELALPFLLILGGADRLIPPDRSRQFFGDVMFGDKELKEYPGAYHEPHNDIIADRVVADLGQWLDARRDSARPGVA